MNFTCWKHFYLSCRAWSDKLWKLFAQLWRWSESAANVNFWIIKIHLSVLHIEHQVWHYFCHWHQSSVVEMRDHKSLARVFTTLLGTNCRFRWHVSCTLWQRLRHKKLQSSGKETNQLEVLTCTTTKISNSCLLISTRVFRCCEFCRLGVARWSQFQEQT